MKLLVVGSGGREHAIAKKLFESKDVEKVFVAPGNDGMTLDGLELVNISISEHSKLIEFAKDNDIAWTFIGPDDALAAGIVDDFNQAGSRLLVRLGLQRSWSGPRILLRKSWSNMAFRQQPMAHFQISRKPRLISRRKALLSSSRQTAWLLGKVSSLRRQLSKQSKPLTRCFWTINLVTQVHV